MPKHQQGKCRKTSWWKAGGECTEATVDVVWVGFCHMQGPMKCGSNGLFRNVSVLPPPPTPP